MDSKETFDATIERAEHFLTLYELLKNGRKRKPKSTWSSKFKTFMNWKQKNPIMRIDGKDSLLIIRKPSAGLTYERFEHDYLSELLRSAIVASVSSLDKYLHDIAIEKCYALLTGPESVAATAFICNLVCAIDKVVTD